jgi:hypothetical protein
MRVMRRKERFRPRQIQGKIIAATPPVLKPRPFREGSYISAELNTSTPVPEWGGQKVPSMMEEDAYLTPQGIRWFRPRQTSFCLIR